MTSVGICASVVSGAKILVCDRLLKVPDTTTLAQLFERVKPDGECVVHEDVVVKCSSKPRGVWLSLIVGVATKAAGAGLLTNRPTDSLCKAIVGLPETRYFFVVA